MSEKTAEFYNKYSKRAFVGLDDSAWLPLYKIALKFLPNKNKNPKIIDLGCGTGRFAKLAYRNGYIHYWGIDFAAVLIEEAQEYVPEYTFNVLDVFSLEAVSRFKEFDTFVALEILEHLNEDLQLIESVPSGRRLIFSVPNYLSKAHVRAFNNVGEVYERYGHLLDFLDFDKMKGKEPWNHIAPNGEKQLFHIEIFVFKCIRK